MMTNSKNVLFIFFFLQREQTRECVRKQRIFHGTFMEWAFICLDQSNLEIAAAANEDIETAFRLY